jgi:hypothetical protein
VITRRDGFALPYGTARARRINLPGAVKPYRRGMDTHQMPVARPVVGWSAHRAPDYITGATAPRNRLITRGAPGMQFRRPRLEMDPRNPRTWQRHYVFTR